jgi:hypothetical protein
MSLVDMEAKLRTLKVMVENTVAYLPIGFRHRTMSPRVAGQAANSISGDHHLQHQESIKPDSRDLKDLTQTRT